MSFRPTHAYGLSVGYQAVALGPDVKDFSIVFATLEGAKEFIRERGPYFDAMWIVIGPAAFFMWDDAPVTHLLHRTIRETLLETYSNNNTSLTIGFPLNYIIDRNPLPKDQQGGYDAVIVQYPHYGPGATLFKTVWCLAKTDAIKALQTVNMDGDVPGPMFKAIIGGPDEIYDKNGEPASRELYDSVKGITCYNSISDGNENMQNSYDERPLIGPYGDPLPAIYTEGEYYAVTIFCMARTHMNTVTEVTDFNCYGCKTFCLIPEQHVGCYAAGAFKDELKLEPQFERKLCELHYWPDSFRFEPGFGWHAEHATRNFRQLIQLLIMDGCRFPSYMRDMYAARTDCVIL